MPHLIGSKRHMQYTTYGTAAVKSSIADTISSLRSPLSELGPHDQVLLNSLIEVVLSAQQSNEQQSTY